MRPPRIRCRVTGKRVFGTRATALAALERIQARPDPSDPKLPRAVYRCPECGCFHLTCTPQKPAQTSARSSSLSGHPK